MYLWTLQERFISQNMDAVTLVCRQGKPHLRLFSHSKRNTRYTYQYYICRYYSLIYFIFRDTKKILNILMLYKWKLKIILPSWKITKIMQNFSTMLRNMTQKVKKKISVIYLIITEQNMSFYFVWSSDKRPYYAVETISLFFYQGLCVFRIFLNIMVSLLISLELFRNHFNLYIICKFYMN